MVRVLGEAPEMFKQTVCKHCAAKLEYTLSEVRQQTVKDYGGGSDLVKWIDCPRCTSKVIL